MATGRPTSSPRHDPADRVPQIVVLVGAEALAPEAGAPWLRRALAHLSVIAQDHRVVVGPLVVPGRGRACAAWTCTAPTATPPGRRCSAQLAAPAPRPAGRPVDRRDHPGRAGGWPAGCDGRAHAALDGQDAAASGVSLEVSLPLAAGGGSGSGRLHRSAVARRRLGTATGDNGPGDRPPPQGRDAARRRSRQPARSASPGAPPSGSASGSVGARPRSSPPSCRPAPPSSCSRCSASSRAGR